MSTSKADHPHPPVAISGVLALLIALVAGGAAASADATTSAGRCKAPGSRTLASTHEARVFQTRPPVRIFGCLRSRGNLVNLERASRLPGSEFPERPFALAGHFVAFRMDNTNPDIGKQDENIVVIDIASGRRKHLVTGIFDHANREPHFGTTVENIALRRTGSAAWLGHGHGTEGGGREIYRVDRRGVKRLDKGTKIQARSLRLRGRTLSWINDGVRRTGTVY